MKKTIKNNGVAGIEELRELSHEADVKIVACQMTVELFGFDYNDFIPKARTTSVPLPSCRLHKNPMCACLSDIGHDSINS